MDSDAEEVGEVDVSEYSDETSESDESSVSDGSSEALDDPDDEPADGDEVVPGVTAAAVAAHSAPAPPTPAARMTASACDTWHYEVVPDAERRTSNVMSQHELAQLVRMRVDQIAKGEACFDPEAAACAGASPLLAALTELRKHRFPLMLQRVVHTDERRRTFVVERWRAREMAVHLDMFD